MTVMSDAETVYYYRSAHRLDALIADVFSDIHEVVREVERLCDDEARVARNYRQTPADNYMWRSWHPWWSFVITGNATHLGWEPNDVPPGARRTAWSEVYR